MGDLNQKLSSLHILNLWRLDNKKKPKSTRQYLNKKVAISLFLIMLLGGVLRMQHLADKALWYDEAYSAEMITNSYSEVFRLSKLDVHPPLYYIVLKSWAYLGNSELLLRIPSVIFGLLLIPLIFKIIVYLTSDTQKGLVGAMLIASNPFFIMYSREARSNSLLALLTALSFFLVLKAIKDKHYGYISLVLPLLFLTHYISVFFIFIFVFLLILNDRKSIAGLIPLFTLIIVWAPVMIGQSVSTGLQWIPDFYWFRISESLQIFLFGASVVANSFFVVTTTILLSALLTVYLIKSTKNRTGKFLNMQFYILVACVIAPLLTVGVLSKAVGINLYLERNLIGSAALLIVLISIILPSRFRYLSYIYVCVSLFSVFNYTSTYSSYRQLGIYSASRQIVMADATDYINVKYYSTSIKLQDGNWEEWGIVKDKDIFDKSAAKDNFYLVSSTPIKKYHYKFKINKFYFYEWDV